MADEIIAGATPVAVEAPAVAPVASVAPPVVSPVVEAASAPVAPPEPIAEAASVEPVAPVAEAPVEVAPTDKPAESAAEPIETPKPTYEAFTLPEGLNVAPEQLEAFTSVLAEYGLTQEAGQKLMDLHAGALKEMSTQFEQRQRDAFDQTRADWRGQVDKKFGNRRDAVVNDAKWAIETLVPTAKERQALWSTFAYTGVGDHPAMIDLLSRAAAKMRERAAPATGVPNTKPISAAERRYSK
jgi:hypothetical protein